MATISPASAQEDSGEAPAKTFWQSLDETVESGFKPVSDKVTNTVFWGPEVIEVEGGDNIALPLVLVWLVVAALIMTLYFKFVNLRSWKIALRTVKGRYSGKDDPGEITHFQALSAALSGTVGLGNIAGVAVAVGIGGPGATFWMIIVGLLGMTSKFVECTLGVKYRKIENGRVYGGPMHYLTTGLKEKGLGGLGVALAIFFSIMCIGGSFGGGNMVQANQATAQIMGSFFGAESSAASMGWVVGVIMAVLVGLVILGGITSIAKVTAVLVPFMCGTYILAALVVIGLNLGNLGGAFGTIFQSAFDAPAVAGGIIGVMIQGIKRAAFSNEAGIGSAPIAHSAVKTKFAASEGLVGLLEPFIDTVVVCTMTALVIVVTGAHEQGLEGIAMTSFAFEQGISWFPYVLSIAAALFAFSTMLSWSYYGQQSWAFLFGKAKWVENLYKLIFCLMIVVGSAASLSSVINFSDSMIFAMAVPNIIGLYILLPVVKGELQKYREHVARVDA